MYTKYTYHRGRNFGPFGFTTSCFQDTRLLEIDYIEKVPNDLSLTMKT